MTKITSERLTLCFVLSLCLLGFSTLSFAQSTTPLASTPGTPTGSYPLSDFDTVNLFSGNLNVSLPLVGFDGRGSADIGVSLNIEHQWSIRELNQDEWEIYNHVVDQIGTVGKVVIRSNFINTQEACDQTPHWWIEDSLSIVVVSPNGTELTLIDPYYKGQVRSCGFGPNGPEINYGHFFQSVDGSFTTFIADSNIYSIGGWLGQPIDSPVSGFLYRQDGSKTRVEDGRIVWIQDRNGNRSTFSYPTNGWNPTSLKDSNGREVQIDYRITEPAPYGLCNKITYKGSSGQERIIRISLGVTTRAPVSGTDDGISLEGLITTDPNDWPQIRASIDSWNEMPKAVWLPDGRSYQFRYNTNGRIAEITLPTGGKIEYDFYPTQLDPPFNLDYFINRVKEKRIIDENGFLVSKTLFSKTVSGGESVVTVEQRNANDDLLAKSKHYFFGNADGRRIFYDWAGDHWWGAYDGKEKKTEQFDLDGNTVLTRIERTLLPKVDPDCYYDPNMHNPCSLPAYPHVPNSSPIEVETKTTLVDTNQVSVVTSINPATQKPALDTYNHITDQWIYDFGTGQKGAFLKRVHTDFREDSNYTDRYLRNLPNQTWISSDVAGTNRVSLTKYEYDDYSADSTHAGLLTRNSVIGHDSTNYGTNFVYRGNVTAVTSYSDAKALTGAVSVHSQYDILGNVVKTIDANGNATAVNYNDNFGSPDGEATTNSAPTELNGQNTFAFATSSTNPLGWTGYVQYDYHTGASVNTQDIKGIISKTIYNDALDRPTQTVGAVGTSLESQTTISYDDANRRVQTTADLNTLNDNLLKSESFYDGLGRTIESRTYKDGGYISVKTEYDALGRVSRVSNPYRPGMSETPVWTESAYDSLGRIIEIETPDGANVHTAYSGNRVLITDQAGKKRLSRTNAGGSLTDVWEITLQDGDTESVSFPGETGLHGYKTSYVYDVLGNLTTVNQGAQTRTFSYDSLSRLMQGVNPESGTINYSYDANGNLTTKVDARGVQTDYVYDALNRVTNRNYSLTGSTPPNYQATPNVSYFYDNLTNAKGKLIKVQNSVSTTEYTSFDILGRVTAHKQTTDGEDYATEYVYNLSGALVEQTYPSGRKVKNTLDVNGDLAQVQSRTANDTFRNYANSFTYTAAGAVSSLRLGNGRWENTQFNSRLQPTQIGLGSGATSQNLLKLDYTYNTSSNHDNNGNILSQTITVPSVGQTPGFAAVQTYTYDSLNRINDAVENITPVGGSSSQSWKQTFTYDRYGNRNFDEAETTTLPKNCGTSPNFTVCAADKKIVNPSVDASNNRLSSSDNYVFDDSGNTIEDAHGRTFIYDAENKQIEVKDQYDNTIGEYFYDGDGRRIKKIVPSSGEVTVFVYSAGGQLVAEYSTIQPQTPKISYTTSDHLGSPRILTDQFGSIISRRDFMPFGEEIYTPERTQNLSYGQDDIRQKFTGYERDSETDLDFAQARMLTSDYGRFTSPDPYNIIFEKEDLEKEKEGEGHKLFKQYISQPQNWNRYVYVWNNPLRNTDPDGEKVYVVLYTTGNSNGDDEFRRAAETKAQHIREDGQFDSKKDTVLVKGVRTKEDAQKAFDEAAGMEKDYGKVQQVQIFSHADKDGPVFHPPGSGPSNGLDGVQWSASEVRNLKINWGSGGTAFFFGCNTANFAQTFANGQGVTSYGYDMYALFSGTRSGYRTDIQPNGPVYLVGADGYHNSLWGEVRDRVGYGRIYNMVKKKPNR